MAVALRTRLVISFVIVALITGAVATLVGVHLIGRGIIQQAQEKVRTDLNSAREIYQREIDETGIIVRLTAERFYIKDALIRNDLDRLNSELTSVRERERLDVLTLTNPSGKVIVRARNPKMTGDDQTTSSLVKKVLSCKAAIAGTEIVPREELEKESGELVEKSRFELHPAPSAGHNERREQTSGMMIKAAAPILNDKGDLLGVLYGGSLVNRNYKIVDKIKETVFQGQRYKGRDIGTATIFLGNLRISTNVLNASGERAIGTRIAAEVEEQVLDKGAPWIDRAFVVNDWFITAYEPIRDTDGRTVGALYVGILEAKFVDMERAAVMSLVGVTIAGVIMALCVAFLLANGITRPVRRLAEASQDIAKGNFDRRIEVLSRDEIGQLGEAFNAMAAVIKERDDKLKADTQQALLHMEKMSSLGQMAAGVAHEINNPLTGVLTYVRLMRKNLRSGRTISHEELETKLDTMEKELDRCAGIARGLLGFSRQTTPSFWPTDIRKTVENTLMIIMHQAEIAHVKIVTEIPSGLPEIEADPDQLQQVFLNIALNAVQAMPKGGTLAIGGCRTGLDNLSASVFPTRARGSPPRISRSSSRRSSLQRRAARGSGSDLPFVTE
jgi:two-component system NtrC family sensor kinase